MAVAYSTDLRERVVRAYQAGAGTQVQIAQRFQVSPSFVQRLLRRYRQSGQVTAKQRGGNHQPKIQGEHLDLVKRLVQAQPDAYLSELAQQFTEQTAISVNRVTMHRCIQRLRLSTKKTLHANEQDSERVQALRHEYRRWLDLVKSRNFVFIDESGVNLAMSRLQGRSPIGERVVDSTPRNQGQNISVLGALSFDGVLAMMTIAGSVDTAVFRTYVTQVLVPQLWTGAIVLCDNLQVHKAAGIRESIEAVGAKLVFLPPYSPDLSPIELCWSKLKHLLRSAKARTYADLNSAITAALDHISPDDAAGWFAHCGLFN